MKYTMKRSEFCELIKEHEKQLYAIAYAILRNEADTEDAVCNAIQKGYEKLEQLRSTHKFKAWMAAITRNEALQIKRKRIDLPGDDKLGAMLDVSVDHHDELWDIVQSLQEEYRLVIVLYYYNDLSISEISKVLEIPVGTVKSRMNRGRKLLREAISDVR